jgi:hypothetical protein
MSAPAPNRKPSRSFAERERTTQRWLLRVGRGLLLAVLGFFTASLAFGKTGWIFVDPVNLVLHEAGHFLFRPFGQTMSVLGGTLHQLLWPALFATYFGWRRKDRFAALVCLWWFGENLVGISVYIRDAIDQGLPLVGGEIHDWNYLLGRWDVLGSCLGIGNAVRVVGWTMMAGTLLGVAWMAVFPRRRDVDAAEGG